MYGDVTTNKERMYKPLPYWVRDILQGFRITLGVALGLSFLWFIITFMTLAFN